MRRRVVGFIMGITLMPAPVLAQQPDEAQQVERAKASFKAGATAYAAGEYLAAIQALESAYALTPIPAIGFSLAQAERRQYFAGHEREHLGRAIALFRRYVDEVPVGGRRADALDALGQLEPLAAVLAGGGSARGSGEADTQRRRTRVMITSESPGARLAIDDAVPSPSPLIREVAPGQHRVSAVADGFYPEQRQVTAVQGELIPEVVSLKERPSRVILAAPAGSDLYVDGSFASRGGEHVVLELPSGSHRLTVSEKGRRVWVRPLELERGKTYELAAVLEPTAQRRAAVVLFWSGAAALASGGVFSVLAVGAESRARIFLERQSDHNVGSDELAGYQADRTDRARDRAAATIAFATAAGLFITSAFLYQLDSPSAEQLSRTGAERPTLRLAPVALPTSAGALVQGTF